MKLFTKEEIKAWDLYTIDKEVISSIALMERASKVFVRWYMSLYFDKNRPISVIVGCGNNGGDGLAVARLLKGQGYLVHIHYMKFSNRSSKENLLNFEKSEMICLYNEFCEIDFVEGEVIIDSLLGAGINGAIRGEYHKLVTYLNQTENEIVSIDVPSGMNPDGHEDGIYIDANRTLSFECPKISFFTHHLDWNCRSIGLSKGFIKNKDSEFNHITREIIRQLIEPRADHKSKHDFGFAQFCGGSPGMIGSVILAARAAMRCGIGRLSVTIPKIYQNAFLASCPEVMVQSGIKANNDRLSEFALVNKQVSALAVGSGLGTSPDSVQFLEQLMTSVKVPILLDADALNIISKNKWQERIPRNSILTPHEKEFERLFGKCSSRWERVKLQRTLSKDLCIYIILKGSNTAVTSPDGKCYFNNTGNVGLATAGTGDVLAGMVLSFLGQGYSALDSCLIGVYLHGLSGDHAKLKYGTISLIASDIIEFLPEVIKNIYGE